MELSSTNRVTTKDNGSKSFGRRLSLFLLMALFLFNTQFIIIGTVIKSYWICIFGLAVYEIFRYGIVREYYAFLSILILTFLYLLVNKLIFQVFDEFVSLQVLSATLILFSASSLVRFYRNLFPNSWRDVIINHMVSAALLNSIVILLSVFSSEFRDLFYSIIYVTEKSSRYLTGTEVHTPRYPGLTVSGFSFLSLMTALILLAAVLHHIFVLGFSNGLKTLKKFICISLIAFSLIFVARTGLLISLAIITVYIAFIVGFNLKRNKYTVPLFILFFLSTSVGLVFYLLEDYAAFAFELFINYFSGDGFSTTSTDNLKDNEFFFNDDNMAFLFGSGNFGRDSDYIDSDIGWVLFFSGAGLIGSAILYLPLMYLAVSGYIYRTSFFVKIYMLISVTMLLLANFKDIYYLSHGYIQPVILFFVIIIHDKSRFAEFSQYSTSMGDVLHVRNKETLYKSREFKKV